MIRTIAAAAVLLDGKIYTLPPPARHHTIMHWLSAQGISPHLAEQGFVDNEGKFLGRHPALQVAADAGQFIRDPTAPANGLFSEDVW